MSRERTCSRRLSLAPRGLVFAFVLGLLLAPAGARAAQNVKAPSNDDCLACHSDPEAKRESGSSIAVLPEPFGKSVHGPMSCVDCHVDLATTADFPHRAKLKKVDCGSCHEDVPKDLRRSVHARVTAGPDGPDCVSCHGPAHQILPRTDPASMVAKANLAGDLRLVPQQPRLPRPSQDPVRAPGRCLSAERPRPRGGAGEPGGGLVLRLPRQPRRPALAQTAARRPTTARFPRPAGRATRRSRRSTRTASTAGGRARGDGVSGLHRLPRRARPPGSERAQLAGEPGAGLHRDLRPLPCRRAAGRALQPAQGQRPRLPGQLPRPRPAFGQADRGQLRLLPRRPQHPPLHRPALHHQPREPGEDLRRVPPRAPASASPSAPST